MIFKKLLRITILAAVALFVVSCDDDIDTIGQGIQPEIDDIFLDIDSVSLTAETVSLNDRIYVRAENMLLGELNDPVFKNIKADFLTELFTTSSTKFDVSEEAVSPVSIDSVLLGMSFLRSGFMGDTLSPMAVSVYEVNNLLKSDFYTDIDPAEYCDKSILLGERFFTFQGLATQNFGSSSDYIAGKLLKVELDKKVGENIFERWQEDKTILSDAEKFRNIFKGLYVTSDFDNKGLINVIQTDVYIYYSYKIKNVAKTDDSLVYRVLPLPSTNDIRRMNRVVNSEIDYGDSGERVLLKSPGGYATKIKIPLAKIKEQGKERIGSDKFIINSAKFNLTGMTEEEDKLSITSRPSALLFINKDSIDNYFYSNGKVNAKNCFVMIRDKDNNSYNFATSNSYQVNTATGAVSSSQFSNNIASLVNHYLEVDPDKEYLEYLAIPVTAKETSSYTTYAITGVENLFSPTAAILRTQEEYMKMSLVFSKHNLQVAKDTGK